MKYASFQCVCPYELDDKVECHDGVIRTIDDIRTVHELRNKNVYFEYYLLELRQWVAATLIIKLVKE